MEKKIQDRKNLHGYRGHARFVAAHRVRVGEEELESERIFIDAGARPKIPRIEGLDRTDYLTNASIMDLTELPEHLLILGGGYIGLECRHSRAERTHLRRRPDGDSPQHGSVLHPRSPIV